MPARIPHSPTLRQLTRALLAVSLLANAAAAQLPRAIPNEHRTSAGRVVAGELHVALEAVIAEWRPRGETGPMRKALTFAEVGKAPSAPGPMIRTSAGRPVRVTIRNTLAHPVRVVGLGDRTAAPAPDTPPVGPEFLRGTSLAIAPGETREIRFTPSRATTSFYTAILEGPPAEDVEIGLFEGAYIVDPEGQAPPADERVMMISTGLLDEDSPTFKMFINGTSWPYTERLTYTVGDTVRWRVINTAGIVHPMHLHGFYFNVDARGNGDVDTVYAAEDRPHVVTDRMNGVSTLRMSWVATEPGNWLFHCHLIRHMADAQRYASERAADRANAAAEDDHAHAEHDMAGLIMGITVRQRPGVALAAEPAPARRIDLWTGTRPGVYAEGPELAFVMQQGAVPAADSTHVPGTTLRLREGEPTQIVVHNRLHFPLSLHWHGLELRSAYDGVGGWSGDPDSPRRPIAPGDSMAVLITPPRAGTFMYHTHGEPGHELSQGLYGGFIVHPADAPWDPRRDRLFMLASRGAVVDAPPAVNGRAQPPTETFTPSEPVRLRFGHISEDELKTVRLLRDGQPIDWRLLAKDGAELPESQRVMTPARLVLGVGETQDVEWTPTTPGLYVLEVRTTYYPQRGGAQIQRVPFAVGPVADATIAAAIRGTDLPIVELDTATLGAYAGIFAVAGGDATAPQRLRFQVLRGRLYSDKSHAADTELDLRYLIPLGDDVFAYGRFNAGVITQASATHRARFLRTGALVSGVEITDSSGVSVRLARIAELVLSEPERERLLGAWVTPDGGFTLRTEREGNGVALVFPDGTRHPLLMESSIRFLLPSLAPGLALQAVLEDDRVVAIELTPPGQGAIRFGRVPSPN